MEICYSSAWCLPEEEENRQIWFSRLYSWLDVWDYGNPLTSKWAICHKVSERICPLFAIHFGLWSPNLSFACVDNYSHFINHFRYWKIFKHHCDRSLLRRQMSILRLHHFSIKRDLHPRFRSNLQLKCAKMSDWMQQCNLMILWFIVWLCEYFSFLYLLTTVSICGSLY